MTLFLEGEVMKIKVLILMQLMTSITGAISFDPMKHVVRQESFWGNYKHRKITEKIQTASPEVIDYLTQDNIQQGWPNRPTPADLSKEFQTDLIKSLEELPIDLSAKINKKLTGIAVVNNLGGSAYSEYVLDSKGNPVSGFIILDISTLDRTANKWATWKEQSPFKTHPRLQLIAEIEAAKNDNRKNAIQYILLHEFGHILSIGLDSVVPWGLAEDQMGSLDRYAFSALSWRMDNKKLVSIYDTNKLNRHGLRYYASENERLPGPIAQRLYSQLENTNFPTLYAATNPFDDFAESFVSYVHSVYLKKPWKIKIISENKKMLDYRLCWNEQRCRAKRKLLEKILEAL